MSKESTSPFTSGFKWMWGAIAAVAVVIALGLVIVNSSPYRRSQLEAEGREWERKGVIQTWEREDYADFQRRYRQEFGRDW